MKKLAKILLVLSIAAFTGAFAFIKIMDREVPSVNLNRD